MLFSISERVRRYSKASVAAPELLFPSKSPGTLGKLCVRLDGILRAPNLYCVTLRNPISSLPVHTGRSSRRLLGM